MNTAKEMDDREYVKINQRTWDMLIGLAEQSGFAKGQAEATSIALGYSGYGSCDSAIVVVPYTGFQALRQAIRSRRWRKAAIPGYAYAGQCKLLMVHKGDDGQGSAVLLCSTNYDV